MRPVARFLPSGAAHSLPYWEKAASAGRGSSASPGNQPVIPRVMAKLQMQPENLTSDGKVERSQMPSGVTKAPAAATDLRAPSNYQGGWRWVHHRTLLGWPMWEQALCGGVAQINPT